MLGQFIGTHGNRQISAAETVIVFMISVNDILEIGLVFLFFELAKLLEELVKEEILALFAWLRNLLLFL